MNELTPEESATLLVGACRAPASVDSLLQLLQCSTAGINAQCPFTEASALHAAVEEGSIDHIRLLVEYKADVNIKSRLRNTPLANAITYGDMPIATYLVEHGTDVNTTHNARRMTPLMSSIVSSKCSLEFMQLLIDYRADVNAKDETGLTPLMYALKYRKGAENDIAQVVRLLLQNGAFPSARSHNGVTPLQCAMQNVHHEAMVNVLLPHITEVNGVISEMGLTALMTAVYASCSLRTMDALLQHKADINYKDPEDNRCALKVAVEEGKVRHAKWLLEHGASMDYEYGGVDFDGIMRKILKLA